MNIHPTNDSKADLLCLRDVAKLVPSHVPGKKVHIGTVVRWILSGRLPAVKRGRYYFVRRADVDALTQPIVRTVAPRVDRRRRRTQADQRRTMEYLRSVGIA